MSATNLDISWARGQTEEWTLSVLNADGTPYDLSTALAIEFEVKKYASAADPATLHLEKTHGITVRTQTSPNVGVCDVVATAAQTATLTARTWHYDVFVTRADSARKLVMYGKLYVFDTVNPS